MPILEVGDWKIPCKGILFDKDGTLLHFMTLWGSWADAVMRRMKEKLQLAGAEFTGPYERVLGVLVDQAGRVTDYDKMGPLAMSSNEETIAILAWQLYVAGWSWNEAILQATQVCKNAMWDVRKQKPVKSMPGLINFLKSCQLASMKLGVVTSDDTETAVEQLCWAGLDSYFDIILGRDQVQRGKPFPDLVEKASQLLELRADQLIMIGDTNGDMQMGKQSGMRMSIAIADSPTESKHLLLDADVIIADYSELKTW